MRKSLTVSVVIALALLLGPGLFFLWWPTWLTGGCGDYTVLELTVAPNGMVTVRHDVTIPYGHIFLSESIPDDDGMSSASVMSWEAGPTTWLRWPRQVSYTTSYLWITGPEEINGPVLSAEVQKQRLLLKPGTYRIRSGESMAYCRKVYPDGRVGEGTIRLSPVTSIPSRGPRRTWW